MRKSVWIALALSGKILWAQSLNPQVIGAAGGSATPGSNDFEWTIGEAAIDPNAANNVTIGFQEYELPLPTAVAPKIAPGFSVRQFPGLVRIQLEPGLRYSVRLFNGRGRLLSEFATASGQRELEVPTREYSGLVLMNIDAQNGPVLRGYKLIGGK